MGKSKFNSARLNTAATSEKATQGIESNRSSMWATLSFIFTLIPLFMWAFCFIFAHINYNKGGSADIFWLMFSYYATVGIPFCIMSIVFGLVGLKSSLYGLAIASLVIKAITILTIALLLLLPSVM